METVPKVPIYTFDEHNEAFFFWHKAKLEGSIAGPLDLLHVDAHNDMGRREDVGKSVYVMSEGRIVESGTHQQLLEAGGRYAQAWATLREKA